MVSGTLPSSSETESDAWPRSMAAGSLKTTSTLPISSAVKAGTAFVGQAVGAVDLAVDEDGGLAWQRAAGSPLVRVTLSRATTVSPAP